MRVSYHNHTIWSDGTATLEEMIAGAKAAGLDEFGISDHFALMPGGELVDWAIRPNFLAEYVRRFRAASRPDITLRLGVEMEFFPETVKASSAALARYPFDFILGGVHFANDFPIDYAAHLWEPLSETEINDIWRLYWTRIGQLAASRACDVIAHLDLPKKFGYLPTIDLSTEINAALDAIASAGLAIELNTAGWRKPIAEAYPSEKLLRMARARNIPLVISADAHTPQDVAGDFDRARALARRVGYTESLRFAGGERFPIPL